MPRYVNTDPDTGRIAATSERYPFTEEDQPVDFPDDFDFERQREYRLVDGALVHDPIPEAVPVPTPEEVNAANIAYLAMMTGVSL